jgi:hypothetical protein
MSNATVEPTAVTGKLVACDIDDVLCLNDPYGGYDAAMATRPSDFFQRLFAPSCVAVLRKVHEVHHPKYVLTTSWLRIFDREAITQLFQAGGLGFVVESLHEAWEAPQLSQESRASAIERWMSAHYAGESFVVLDDALSGTGLIDSKVLTGHVVLCEVDIGLTAAHLDVINLILSQPGLGQGVALPCHIPP